MRKLGLERCLIRAAAIRRGLRGTARSVSTPRWNDGWPATRRRRARPPTWTRSSTFRSRGRLYEGVHDPLSTRSARRPRRRTITTPCGARAPCPAAGPDPERGARCRSETGTVPGPDHSTDRRRVVRFGAGADRAGRAGLAHAARVQRWPCPSEPAACRALGIDAVGEHDGRAPHGVVIVRRPAAGRRVSAGTASVELRRCVGTERAVSLSVSVSSGGNPDPESFGLERRLSRAAAIRRGLRGTARSVSTPRWNDGWPATRRRRARPPTWTRSSTFRSRGRLYEGAHDPLSTRSARRPRRRTITAPCGARATCPAAGPDPERGARCRSETGTVPDPDHSTDRRRVVRFGAGADRAGRAGLAHAARVQRWPCPSEPAACRVLGIDAAASTTVAPRTAS